jgi:flagellar basal-body rod protein FlgF
LDSGYYAACQGMRSQAQALDLIANNLANVNTTGYLGGEQTFHSLLASARGGIANPLNRVINNFNTLGDTQLDLHSGNLERTGNPFDLAIEGEGFFAVQTPSGTLYTRNGSFQVSPTGQLITAAGDHVLGGQGPITVPAGQVSISPDGTMSVNGAVAGKLRVVEFAPGTPVEAVGNSLYAAPADKAFPARSSSVRQGMLAASNVNAVAAVVALLTVQRNHDMLQRALSSFDSEFNRIAADDLPKV